MYLFYSDVFFCHQPFGAEEMLQSPVSGRKVNLVGVIRSQTSKVKIHSTYINNWEKQSKNYTTYIKTRFYYLIITRKERTLLHS